MTKGSFFNDISTWQDYVSKQDSLNSKEKGNTFELLTKVYFKISPQFSFYDDVWLLEETPEKILNKIGLPRQDLGVDLIAKSGNEYHAIQCKYHSNKHQKVTYKEVSTFLAAIAKCDKITMGYICSTANVTTKNYDKVPKKLISKILGDTWENLTPEFFNNLKSFLKKKPLKLSVFKPRPHQKKALKDATKYFDGNDRGKLIFPCGSGKSLTGFWITRELEAKNILIAVPSLSLIKQTLDVYLGQIVARKEKVKWLCICSDDSIGKSDDVVMLTEDLGVPCVTDPNYIKAWIDQNRSEDKIIFTTYQSGKLIAEISKKLKFSFDLGIYDEAHKTVGSDKSLFSHLLFEKNISVKKRVFMTATERFYSGSKDDIVSMDNEDIYGDVFSKMTFKDAIEKDLLTDYKIITLDIKKTEISDFIKQNGLVELNKRWKNEPDARSLASMIALRKVMEKYPINNAVSFHSSIEKAKRNSSIHEYVTDQYNFKPISTYTVSGKQPTSERNDIVSDFAKTKKALITNARCLTEGVDVPNIDCIVFADPKKSKIDIVQALGRALRKKDGKEWGYVILPVVYDINNEIDNESFNDVISIIRGLAANDERIIEYFKTKTPSKGGGNKVEASDSVFEMISEKDLSEQLEIKVWEKLSRFNIVEYDESKKWAISKKIKSKNQWFKFIRTYNKPNDIPYNPSQYYKDKGWESWGEFLGTGNIASFNMKFVDFKELDSWVKQFNLKNQGEWYELTKSPNFPKDFPSAPNHTYKGKGWEGWGKFLGTGNIANFNRKFRSYPSAKKNIKKFKFKSKSEYHKAHKSKLFPIDIPYNPRRTYFEKGWESWGEFLGTGNIASFEIQWPSYIDAKKIVKKYKLKNWTEWREFCKSKEFPSNIPKNPHNTYRHKGWISMGDFLGVKAYIKRTNKSKNFEEARKFARSLKLKSGKEWSLFCNSGKKPNDIPKHPNSTYKDKGWVNMYDWLGIEKRTYLNYNDAKKFVLSLNLKSWSEWRNYCTSDQKPDNIPSHPHIIYRGKGWINIADFIGTKDKSTKNKKFRTFINAKKYVHQLDIKNQKEWQKFAKSSKRPDDIPSIPSRVYKKEWRGLADWLGK